MFFSGLVDGVSPAGHLVRFEHERTISTATGTDTAITIQPLTPATTYLLRVSAMTERGPGMDVSIEAQTTAVDSNFGMTE